jgi:hypothetical protein
MLFSFFFSEMMNVGMDGDLLLPGCLRLLQCLNFCETGGICLVRRVFWPGASRKPKLFTFSTKVRLASCLSPRRRLDI